MRLNQIKLSGFKSFLEPTTISFNTALTGIVGPNGCGKSNIVDAIRWVIGESSAKQLRGENLADVIFGGSLSRKPVGKAGVELMIDNSAQRLGGPYRTYHEISIKREITRDGGSSYFLNHTPCRRRDVMDVLLGTGLGPRSYAVIEQGMISHLIAATPEELRGYLEEAAMVSKYKERRKEAETRIANTRENINRMNDLSIEVNERLEKVRAQAETAHRYREWKGTLQCISAQLEALDILALQKKCTQMESLIQEKAQVLADCLQAENQSEQEQEELDQCYQQQTEVLSREQDEYYRFSIEISRLEQALKDAKHQGQRLQENLKQFEQNRTHLTQQFTQDEAQCNLLKQQYAQNEPLLQAKIASLSASQDSLSTTQGAWNAWQTEWDQLNKSILQTHQSMEIKKNHLQQLERLMDTLKHRYEQLEVEKTQLQAEASGHEIAQWGAELENWTIQIQKQEGQIQTVEDAIYSNKQQQDALEVHIRKQAAQLQAWEAEHASLKSLQTLALGKGTRHQAVMDWLNQQGTKMTYLAEAVQVAPRWEKALERVLSDMLDAFCIEDIQSLGSSVALDAGLHLIELGQTLSNLSHITSDRLVHQMQTRYVGLEHHLSAIYIAPTLVEAFKLRSQLKAHESVITPEGIWLGPTWLKTPEVPDERSGILARQQRMQTLIQAGSKQQTLLSEQEAQKQVCLAAGDELRKMLSALQQEKRCSIDQTVQLKANLNAKQGYLDQVEARIKRVETEGEGLEKQLHQQQAESLDLQKQLEMLQTAQGKYQQAADQLQGRQQALHQAFESAKAELRQQEEAANQLKSTLASSQKQVQYLEEQRLRTQAQIQGISQQFDWVHAQYQEVQTTLPRQEADWTDYLEKRAASEMRIQEMKTAHQKTERSLQAIKDHQQKRKLTLEPLRKTLERLRIDKEAAQVQLLHHQAQVTQLGFTLEAVMHALPGHANKSRWLEQQAVLTQNIQNLGEINLAATTEYEALLDRKAYLEKQSQDLAEGLSTLEAAIRKIDQETCVQLKNTFEQVNQNFMDLFSKIFEGGQAALERTQDDWLSTGIVVKAQPKGKRNATIHLLSGGEKALTAIALVFALFKLNPAPFCILDEVDAPLDDHNIGRFCKLVEEMSHTLQFIFISHSKVTLTMAKQLVGVTMREAGVSRVVSVNVEEAIRMTETQ